MLGLIIPSVGAVVTRITPTHDGAIIVEDQATFNDAWTSATGTIEDNTHLLVYLWNDTAAGWYMHRVVMFFDTSSIPDNANISAVRLDIYETGGASYNDTGFVLVAQQGNGTHPNNPLQVTDFDKAIYSGNGGEYTPAQNLGWNNFTLNSVGRGWVDVTGTTVLVLRTSYDVNGTSPPPPGDIDYGVEFDSADGPVPPVLVVTYTYSSVGDGVADAGGVLADLFIVIALISGLTLMGNVNSHEGEEWSGFKLLLSLLITIAILLLISQLGLFDIG